ncbi:T9SS type A sorting domain-containing protein [bacterium]|nr:T9SS type A sorting domain-containing protein [bacterium]
MVDFGYVEEIYPWMVVVKPDKTKVLEAYYPQDYISYRAFNYPALPWQLDRPEVDCQKTGAHYYLVAEPGYNEYLWSTGETTSFIEIGGPGEYWVSVPYGQGYIFSEYIQITDIDNPCLYLASSDPHSGEEKPVLRVNPNPAKGSVTICFSLSSGSYVNIALQALTGAEVCRPVRGYYASGKHESKMDVSFLDSGLYFLSFTSDEGRVVTKLIIR